jgi:hypothetical protein
MKLRMLSGLLCLTLIATTSVRAGSLVSDQKAPASSALGSSVATEPASTRYGLFDLLDHRSAYGQGVFPEPFLVDDSDLETNEARLDWLRIGSTNQHSDVIKAEVEKGFGLLTLELEVPYERDSSAGEITRGFDNIDVGARYPFYQYVSANGFFDTTFGAGIEVGIPTGSDVSQNAELVPKVFNDLKLGDHFTLQSIFGYSTLFGPGEDGGLQTFEYGFVFGYTIDHKELPLPGVLQLIPVFELSGGTELNNGNSGKNSLIADVGLRANLKTIGGIQPRPGLVFVFPIDRGGREELHLGVFASLVFEY